MSFEFSTAGKIIFGNKSISKAADIVENYGRKVLIVCGSGRTSLSPLLETLERKSQEIHFYHVSHEPDVKIITEGVEQGKSTGCDLLIGIGGGSVMDSAKAIAAMMTNPGELLDYLEVVGKGQKIQNTPLPMIAIPTTAGTGTEVTMNAVVSVPEHQVKVSMRSPMMIPRAAIIDPELTCSMPPSLTASTGMDALTQCLEGYVSNKANPLTDCIARDGIKTAAKSLLTAYLDGNNRNAREGMALASLYGGITLANSGLGAVHGFAGVIGGMCGIPHGEVCASLLASVLKHNVQTIKEQVGLDRMLYRFREIAQWLTGNERATVDDGVLWIQNLKEQLALPGLKGIGVRHEDFDLIIEKASISSSMQKNPVKLSKLALEKILKESF
jgi:alcohol dehydrogenase class IV